MIPPKGFILRICNKCGHHDLGKGSELFGTSLRSSEGGEEKCGGKINVIRGEWEGNNEPCSCPADVGVIELHVSSEDLKAAASKTKELFGDLPRS